MATFLRDPQLAIVPFHRDPFKTDAYVFQEDPGPLGEADFYRQKTSDLQGILADQLTQGAALRGVGSSWSLSDVGVTRGSLVTTQNWSQVFELQNPGTIHANYQGTSQDQQGLRLVEAGVSMKRLDEFLLDANLSVKAHGSNNGQSLVGAASTNTHGGAFGFGSIHDAIVGIHLVAGPTESVYLEKATYPVLDPSFVTTTLQARLISSNELFNAAVVSFGSMGIIRGVVIETRPLFTLEARLFPHDYNDALRAAMTRFDFDNIDTGDIGQHELVPAWRNGRELYHFEVIFNPNDPANDTPENSRALLNLMVADPDLTGWATPGIEPADLTPGATEVMARVLAALGPFGQLFARDALNQEIAKHLPEGQVRAPIRLMFRGQVPQAKAFATGVALPAERSPEAFDIALGIYRDLHRILPVLIGARYVKRTPATLGFTRFPNTCVLEVDGIRHVGVEGFFDRVLDGLEAAGFRSRCTGERGSTGTIRRETWRLRTALRSRSGNRLGNSFFRRRRCGTCSPTTFCSEWAWRRRQGLRWRA
jgi:hypothetical protein